MSCWLVVYTSETLITCIVNAGITGKNSVNFKLKHLPTICDDVIVQPEGCHKNPKIAMHVITTHHSISNNSSHH